MTIQQFRKNYTLTEEESTALSAFETADSSPYTPSLEALTEAITAHRSDFIRKLQELKLFIDKNPEIINSYQALLAQIKQLEQLPRSKKNERELLLQDLVTKTKEIAAAISTTSLLCIEFRGASNALSARLNEDMFWLEQAATIYFREQLKNLNITLIEFFVKTDGDQLGRRMRITYLDADQNEKGIFYFIKTQQEGARRNMSSTTAVHPEEIFFYKLLELTGLGPKAHFFSNPLSTGAYFIATQDEGFTKKNNVTKFFETYGKLKDTTTQTMQDFVLCTDILMRLFYLWDILTNSGNYGKVSAKHEDQPIKIKWRVIDFRVDTENHFPRDDIIDDFLAARDMGGYLGNLKTVSLDLTSEERLASAQRIIQTLENPKPGKLPLKEATKQAFCFTVKLLLKQTRQQGTSIIRKDSLGDLLQSNTLLTDEDLITWTNQNRAGSFGNYLLSVLENYKNFRTKINAMNYKHDNTDTPPAP